MVVIIPAEASHASMRRRRAGVAGSGGIACAPAATTRGDSAPSTALTPCTPPPARNNRRESRERAVQQTNRLYSRCGDSATSARAKCGRRVLPPFVRFSAVFTGRAHAHGSLCSRSTTRAHVALPLAPGTGAPSAIDRRITIV